PASASAIATKRTLRDDPSPIASIRVRRAVISRQLLCAIRLAKSHYDSAKRAARRRLGAACASYRLLPDCYPTPRDEMGQRTIREPEIALFSGPYGMRRDEPRYREPNFKTAALNHSAILPSALQKLRFLELLHSR